jgi:hypothetical protein
MAPPRLPKNNSTPIFQKVFVWILATVNEQPAGALRLFYDPPLELPAEFKVTLRQDVDLKQMAQNAAIFIFKTTPA